jgi:superfamily II DNA or RNA helicase
MPTPLPPAPLGSSTGRWLGESPGRAQEGSATGFTDFHAKFFAHDLLRRHASDSIEKLAAVLADAQVDLNPHQVEAALFAFRSPFSKGAILADEVGLGKTIEAGLLISQRWAERKRHLLVIVPANLRKQWSQELADKFYLPSVILEAKSFNEVVKAGNLNPFDQESVIICSYQFARSKQPYVRQTGWNLIVIDEAHRLRNVYKKTSKIATAIKEAVEGFPKVLLTATPLQNSLLELYGLVSIIDDFTFGDLKSYRTQFARVDRDESFKALKQRLQTICKRTLRRQVLEYISFTNRHAIVQEFYPSHAEQELYDLVSEYLQRPSLYALPARQRHLMTLILRKLLASSSRAIAGTLEGLVHKLEDAESQAAGVEAAPDALPEDWEQLDELSDEWEDDDEAESPPTTGPIFTPEQLVEMRQEIEDLKRFLSLARSIQKDSKGQVLLTALRRGFAAAKEARERQGAATLQQKAIIFTESRRTQQYLFELLEQTEFAGQVMLFNGSNNHPTSKAIYEAWLEKHAGTDRISASPSANMRAALVEYFRDGATILIATEAAAEGVNLQFCNLVVNYDLPWNPQRVEQRIGRCHRYGQKFDVVVVNFLNKQNAADQRVYELLDQKFKLFDGVFGASDEVLGTIGSGIDFEKRIADIYQLCRTPQQIQFEFDQLQEELEEQITVGQHDAREKLLDNFDQEVVEKVRLESLDVLDRFNEKLWQLTKHALNEYADFEEGAHSFVLHTNPFAGETIHPGPYRMGKAVEDANTYRVGHALAQRLLQRSADLDPHPARVTFYLSGGRRKIAILEALVGKEGWLACDRLTMHALETEDVLVLAGISDDGQVLDEHQCRRLLDLPGILGSAVRVTDSVAEQLAELITGQRAAILNQLTSKNGHWFDGEMDKLDRWAEDRRAALKAELDELDATLKEQRRSARGAPNLPEKLALQKEIRTLESRRGEAWRSYDTQSRDIDKQKEALLDEIGKRMEQRTDTRRLFVLHWGLE